MGYLNVERLEPGMILNDDVINSRYRVPLAKKGVLITPELIRKFISHGISVINIHHPQEVAEQIVDETSMVLADLFENFNNISQKDYARLLPYIDEIVATIKKFGREIVDELFLLWRMDQYTFHHSVGTAFYSGLIAQELGYSD